MPQPSRYSPELRERTVRMVFDHAGEHPSQWATIRSVARKLGCTVEARRRWVRQAERDVEGWTNPELKEGIHSGDGVVHDGKIMTPGICPVSATAAGLLDGTSKLTQTLIAELKK